MPTSPHPPKPDPGGSQEVSGAKATSTAKKVGAAAAPFKRLGPAPRANTQGRVISYFRDEHGQVWGAMLAPVGGSLPRWEMPREVYDAVAPRLFAPIPACYRPAFPLVREEPMDTVAHFMGLAWKAVLRRHEPRAKGYLSRLYGKKKAAALPPGRIKTLGEAGAVLRSFGLSPWVFFEWCWRREVERFGRTPKLYIVGTRAHVKRWARTCLDEYGTQLQAVKFIVPLSAVSELLSLQRNAHHTLRVRRASLPHVALQVLDEVLPQPVFVRLLRDAHAQVTMQTALFEHQVRQGLWVWPNA